MDRVDWEHSPATSRGLRVLAYLSLGALGGLPVGAVLGAVSSPGRSLAGSIPVAIVLLIAPAIFFIVWRVNQESNEEHRTSLDVRVIGLAVILGGLVVYVLGNRGGRIGLVGLVTILGLAFGGPAMVGVLRSEGTIDVGSGILVYGHDGHEVDVSAISDVTVVRIRTISFVKLSYVPGAYSPFASDTPRFLVMSEKAANTLEELIQRPGRADVTM